ncbi:MAG TPA: GntR family transcriptional regulator [Rhizomicrobium sp.]
MTKIVRHRARDQARETLRDMIVGGRLETGARLDEIGLSQEIGASRTPVREALIALEEEGLVQSRPNHGFTVAALNERLVRETYAILGALEAAAVEAGGDALVAAAGRLAAFNEKLAREKRLSRCYELDREFHRTLVEPCGNTRLLHLLQTHWNQARRIDGGKTRGMADRAGSCSEHAAIVSAIRFGNLEDAAARLRGHWRDGTEIIIAWMRTHT